MNDRGKKPLLELDVYCSEILARLKRDLVDSGLSVVQSFDLRSTRALHDGCTCPHHGTNQCTCELVVLLIYEPKGHPVTLTLDGRDKKTFVFVTDETGGSPRQKMVDLIVSAVLSAARENIFLDQLQDS